MEDHMTFPLTDLEMMTYVFQNEYGIYVLISAFIFGFILSFAVGANDSANSWGTPVGAGTVSLGVAFLLGSLSEVLGSVFLSGEVIKGVAGKSSVINMEMYQSNQSIMMQQFKNHSDILEKEKTIMLGMVTSMVASQIWQLTATYFAWPVSGTHTIISAILGFTLVEEGPAGVNVGEYGIVFTSSPDASSIISRKPDGIFKVLYGLVLSPLISCALGFALYYPLYKFAITSKHASSWTARTAYSGCVLLVLMSMTFFFLTSQGSPPAGWQKEPFGALVGLGVGLVGAIIFMFLVLPILIRMTGDFRLSFGCLSKKLTLRQFAKNPVLPTNGKSETSETSFASDNTISESKLDILPQEHKDFIDESEEVKRIFRPLQVVAACYGALNHGANDVANCIGPLVTVWYIYQTPIGYNSDVRMYGILLWGGMGIALGLVFYGRKVIETMGSKISQMTPSLGFTVVLTASIVIMFCSILGIPASTTHCQVMGVVGAGVAKGWVDSGSLREGLKTVDFHLMGRIAISWIVTIPFALILSMAIYAIARVAILGPF